MNDVCDESTHTANRMGIIDLQMSIIFLVPGHQTFPRLTDQPRSRGTNLSFVCLSDCESMLRRRAVRLLAEAGSLFSGSRDISQICPSRSALPCLSTVLLTQ